ncbi:MAG TPA: sugar ABC transporter permease [Spirochaetia bacterium]|nr:sugar ABC transporter permease [Spirochaetia bacterium]
MRKRRSRLTLDLAGYGFVAPVVLVIGVMIIYPIIRSFIMSVTNWNMASGAASHAFVGLKNFKSVFELSEFGQMSKVTLLYTVIGVLGKMYVGLAVALLLNRAFRGRSIVRALVVVPWAIPSVVVATVFLISLDPTFGIINGTLVHSGIIAKGIPFLSVPALAMTSIIGVAVWRYFPFVTLMLLAGLQGIPKELYEVAAIDGANAWRRFLHVTWPLLKPVWSIVLILQIVWTIREFDLVYLITKGGPGSSTAVIGVDIYLNAFRYLRLGTAAAESVFLTLISMIFALFYMRAVRKSEGKS